MWSKSCLLFFSFFVFVFANAQFIVKGKVTDNRNHPLVGASISVKDSYSGATSGNEGEFSFTLEEKGPYIILFSLVGYKSQEKQVLVDSSISDIRIIMKEEITEMQAVVLNAGTFEANDKKRATVLKSIDMVTTAGQQADIIAALKTLPGAQQVGEQEGLFVRGGTGNETKVYIDGLVVTNPFFSSVPGIAQRSRFSPLLFKGTVFSSGGYSAQYGQGLSSVLLLETIDLPSRSEVNMIISSAQQSVLTQKLNKIKNTSTGFNIHYSNLSPYFHVIKQKYDYTKPPENINAEFNFRKKWKSGILKTYAYGNFNRLGFNRPNLDFIDMRDSFKLKNHNLFTTATYTVNLKDHWQWYVGTSVSLNKDEIRMSSGNNNTIVSSFFPVLSNQTVQLRSVLTKIFPGLSKIYVGVEHQYVHDGIEAKDSIAKRGITDQFSSAFIETDIYYSVKLVSKAGLRYEYSSLLGKMNISPRASVAYKLNSKSQVSFAYGVFYQKPEAVYLLRKSSLDFTRAEHFILNFQKVTSSQTLRAEMFYKKYSKLLTVGNNAFALANKGDGYAKGIEFFWRDKKTVKNLDYWISYSFLDTKRKFMDYPSSVQPSFAAKHTLSLVAKRFFTPLSTQFSATWTMASGRPYYNPNKPVTEFMTDRTIHYKSLGLQANYLRTFGKVNAVFILNVSNVLGSRQVFSYRYSAQPDPRGVWSSEAITPMAKRFVFAGIYLSIGSDRRKEIID